MATTRGKNALAVGLVGWALRASLLALLALLVAASQLASCGDRDSPEPVRPTPPIPERAPITHVSNEPPPAPEPPLVFPSRWTRATEFPGRLGVAQRAPWRRLAPQVEEIEIASSADGSRQRALFYDSGSPRPKPLLVVLHSWSSSYLQNIHIPYAHFAIENDWVFLHPDFRGPNRNAEATLSELAVRDVLDAVDHARERANVDPSRVYLLGYSSGAMMALVLAGREPQRWAGVAAWVAVYDLADWYAEVTGKRYAHDIRAACGGAPRPGSAAEVECRRRSPEGWLHGAAGRTPVLVAHGIDDRLASVQHAIRAFDALAAPEDRLGDEHARDIVQRGVVPESLREGDEEEPWWRDLGVPVVLQRSSQRATLVLFRGEHDMFYRPGLEWLSRQRRR